MAHSGNRDRRPNPFSRRDEERDLNRRNHPVETCQQDERESQCNDHENHVAGAVEVSREEQRTEQKWKRTKDPHGSGWPMVCLREMTSVM